MKAEPKKPRTGRSMQIFTLRLGTPLREKLERIAAAEGRSRAQVLKGLLRAYPEPKEKRAA